MLSKHATGIFCLQIGNFRPPNKIAGNLREVDLHSHKICGCWQREMLQIRCNLSAFRHVGRVEKHGKIFSPGGMAERLKAHVLKTCLGHTNVGSNPTPSAHHQPVVTTLVVYGKSDYTCLIC